LEFFVVKVAKSRRWQAFTLVELLVVIAIIGVLVGLLLPAVQQAREAARRTSCVNNLKQLALACHSYKDVNEVLPPGWAKPADTSGFPNGNFWGWGAFVLPFVEENALYDRIDFDLQWVRTGNANAGISLTPVSAFLCPSDTMGPLNTKENNNAKSNYLGSFGNKGLNSSHYTTSADRGVFTRNSQLRFRNITDGTSKTLLLGERIGETKNGVDYRAGLWAGIRGEENPCVVGRGPANATNIANTVNGSNSYTLSVSNHPGGSNVAKVDGSVEFLNDSINVTAYRYLIQIDDGQVIPD
jgi:prepilin-type N-terminal cleavage/methylation domain-containing protein/prepilin-type processing-associated H-X9-DG protein